MAEELKPVGEAVATAVGMYPDAAGHHRMILTGERFTVFKGLDKSKWFTVLKADAPAPEPQAKPDPPAPPDTLAAVAHGERKRKAAVKPPMADPSGDDLV